jgi:signal transduction histidine kinase
MNALGQSRGRSLSSSAGAIACLDEVDIAGELSARPLRSPNLQAEHDALAALATEMAKTPRNILQKLVETAVDLCGADSAGISLLEGDVFRWEAVAGAMAGLRNSTMPRNASPCGVCVGRDATQLMYLPDRFFSAIPKELNVVEVLLVPFHNHGKPVGTIWIVAHDSKKKFDREDERRVRLLAQFASAGWQLWKAYETEADANKLKSELVATLGHELRNPLAAIVSASEILKRSELGNRAANAVTLIERQSSLIRRLIDDLVDLSRIARGKLELQRQRIEVRSIVEQAVETTKAHVDQRKHLLSVNIPTRPIYIDGDPIRLVQVLSNLLDNAAKYTPIGGKINVVADSEMGSAWIKVIDTGIGIPAERQEKIFEFFTQFSDPSSPIGGLGIGLALVRTLVELHGGKIEIVSEPGKGSEFTILLPIMPGGDDPSVSLV